MNQEENNEEIEKLLGSYDDYDNYNTRENREENKNKYRDKVLRNQNFDDYDNYLDNREGNTNKFRDNVLRNENFQLDKNILQNNSKKFLESEEYRKKTNFLPTRTPEQIRQDMEKFDNAVKTLEGKPEGKTNKKISFREIYLKNMGMTEQQKNIQEEVLAINKEQQKNLEPLTYDNNHIPTVEAMDIGEGALFDMDQLGGWRNLDTVQIGGLKRLEHNHTRKKLKKSKHKSSKSRKRKYKNYKKKGGSKKLTTKEKNRIKLVIKDKLNLLGANNHIYKLKQKLGGPRKLKPYTQKRKKKIKKRKRKRKTFKKIK